MFGEHLGGMQWTRADANAPWNRQHAFANSWMGAGSMVTCWALKGTPTDTTWEYQEWSMFGSEHPQKVQFAFADGAVRALTEDVSQNVFVFLSGMRDGRIVETDALGL
jgi:prepilin-type processing-associated H-X9-DG protein